MPSVSTGCTSHWTSEKHPGENLQQVWEKKKPNKTLTFLPIREAMLVKNCVYVLSMAKTLVGEPYLGLYPKKQKLV